jgi:endonuclease YncB( thermonuclease family)
MTLHNMVLAFMAFSMKLFCVQGQVADITEAKAGAAFGLSGLLMWYHQPTVLRVVDGDSIKISAPFLPHPLPSTLILRLRGVDTPEVGWRASCSEESQFATMATNGTEGWLQQRTTRIQLDRWDKYGGRVLGDVIDIHTSERLTDWLLAVGLALPYNGRTRPDWCAHLIKSAAVPIRLVAEKSQKESCVVTP